MTKERNTKYWRNNNGGSRATGRINRRLVAAGSGGTCKEAGIASGRVGGGSGSRDGGGRRWRGGGSSSGGREDRIHRRAQGSGREQDQRDQSCPRSHQPRLERSQGTGRWSSEERERRRFQGRSRDHQEEVH